MCFMVAILAAVFVASGLGHEFGIAVLGVPPLAVFVRGLQFSVWDCSLGSL